MKLFGGGEGAYLRLVSLVTYRRNCYARQKI